MIEFEFFDNLLDFIEELYELLKEDWRKFKVFYKENKDYLIWLFIGLITLKFTDLMSLGSSWNKYCKKNNIQTGGANESPIKAPTEAPTETPTEKPKPPEVPKTPEEQAKADKDAKKKEKRDSVDAAKKKIVDKKADKKQEKADKAAGIDPKAPKSNDGGPGKDGEDSVKGIDKKLGFFNKLKGKLKTSAGQHGMAGPVLGNLDGIFGAVGGMFTFVAFILVLLGILSLPVLIFLVITYCIIKKIVGHFALY